MCNLCNGTHVVHTDNQYSAVFHTCPNCGPMTEVEWQARMNMIEQRIHDAELILEKKGA